MKRAIRLGPFHVGHFGIERGHILWLWPWRRWGTPYPIYSISFGVRCKSYAQHLEELHHYNQTLAEEPWTPLQMTRQQKLLNLLLR